MTATTISRPTGLLPRAWATNRPLTLVGVTMAGILAVAAVGLIVDPRVITGAPAWLKPAKFAISIAIYSFTFLWLLTFVSGHRRSVRIVSWVTAVALGLEMVLIAGAAALGTTSHFNVSTTAHAIVWSAMGNAIVASWVATMILAFLLLRQRMVDTAFAWSLRLGVLIAVVGMGVAFFMTAPTPGQLGAAQAGGSMPVVGAHSVGVPDGGPGLPVVGWSTVGGDLRAAHFFGLHGLQALPLLGLLLARFGPAWLRPRDRTALVWTGGLAYLAFVLLTTWQALRGQPIVAPDAATSTGYAAILAATILAVVVVLRRGRTQERPV
jgi:hypothetical protein